MDIIPGAPIKVIGLPFEGYNAATLYNTWLVMAALFFLAWLAVRSLSAVPGRVQVAAEGLTEFFEDICNNTLGEEHGRKYLPFIATLFLFVLFSNVIGSLPNFLRWAGWPGFYCPTQDLNTPLGLALIVVCVVHISAIRVKGFRGWLWSFYEPSFPGDRFVTKLVAVASFSGLLLLSYVFLRMYILAFLGMGWGGRIVWAGVVGGFFANTIVVMAHARRIGRVPNVAMAPLNVVGELGKAISHPFRLFGNIFGGFVILTVVSHLIWQIGLPPFLNLFFGLFIGLVHAFVFAMLALAYTAVQISE
ncbi:MAG: F0F1 ATP synthase subunit A [Candidatus Brocadiae bacterium]|nr:F0F1 ATP synthase subunit A [Candidatus Brocadiia bacterium]